MTIIRVPKTIAEATASLAQLEALVTAKEWTRAAIVYAFTELGTGGRRQPVSSDRLSLVAFAELGIAGLRSHVTVGKYRAAWQYAVDVGEAQPVEPGDKLTEPNLPFPPTGNSRGAIGDLSAGSTAVAKASAISKMLDDPVVAAAVVSRPETVIALWKPEQRVAAARQILTDAATADAVLDEPETARTVRQSQSRSRPLPSAVPRKDSAAELVAGWQAWLNRLNGVLTDGARLAERTEQADARVDVYGEVAYTIYQRITERKIDIELRDLLQEADA